MNKVSAVLATVLLGLSAISVAAPTPKGDDTTAPSYDMKAQALLDLQTMQKKFEIWPTQFRQTS